MALPTQLSYHITRGEPWTRLIIVKDRRAHRNQRPSSASALMRPVGGTVVYPIACTITYEGGIWMSLTADETLMLASGDYEFDVVADPYDANQTVAQGTIEVQELDRITPLGGAFNMIVSYIQNTDYRQSFTWLNDDETVMQIQDARLQARDSLNAVVLDLSYAATPLTEGDIGLLTPEKRGYIAPVEGATFELHISNQAVIAPGSYSFDILAQDTNGDWGLITKGTLTVTASVTDPNS